VFWRQYEPSLIISKINDLHVKRRFVFSKVCALHELNFAMQSKSYYL
jgi:hypothetical protein